MHCIVIIYLKSPQSSSFDFKKNHTFLLMRVGQLPAECLT